MTKFDPNKPVQFRHAPEKVRILATDLKYNFPIAIAVLRDDGREEIRTRHSDGRVNPDRESPYDLVNVPEKHERWANIYSLSDQTYCNLYPTREAADFSSAPNRVACVRVEYTEGEGL
jgi:hypothetical protein